MTEFNILKKSISDYFTTDMLKILAIPLLGSALVLYLGFFSLASSGLDSLNDNIQLQIQHHQTSVQNGVLVQEDESDTYIGAYIVQYLLQYSATSWILSFIVYTIGIFAIGYLSIFISLIIIGFLTPKILAIIHHKHYSTLEVEQGYGTALRSVYTLVKSLVVMVVLFIFLFPLYFIPLVNIIAINLPFFYLFHKLLHYDVSSTILSKKSFDELYYKNKTMLRLKSVLLYCLSLIPMVAFFISIFYIIYLGHSYFNLMQENSIDD
jgi:hypothetical protein